MSLESFLHGVEAVQLNGGVRPIDTVRTSVIGVIGTAPNADASIFPLNVPVLLLGDRTKAAALGTSGTLPLAIDGIYDQCGAAVVVIRVAQGANYNETKANIMASVDSATGQRKGNAAFLSARSKVFITPKILIAPGFTHDKAVVDDLTAVADRLRAMVLADAPSTTDAAAIAYRKLFGSKRVAVYDPNVYSYDTVSKTDVLLPASIRAAGAWSRSDSERGAWFSPSNFEVYGVTALGRDIDYQQGEHECSANFLNENQVNVIVQEEGFRLWGNDTCSSDPMWGQIKRVRVSDLLLDSIQYAHQWAVDQNVTKNFVEAVVEGVNAYMRHLSSPAIGALMPGGKCWADKYYNTKDQLAQKKVRFDFDWCEPATAEHIIFAAHWNGDLLEGAFA